MSDSWVGFPLGFLPEAMDPMHLDQWGWLTPLLISATRRRVYTVNSGKPAGFLAATNLVRGVKIELPDGTTAPASATARTSGNGGAVSRILCRCADDAQATDPIPAGGATLEFQTAYDTEAGYDYFYVEVSTNNGTSWQTLAAMHGRSAGFPNYQAQSLFAREFCQPGRPASLPLHHRSTMFLAPGRLWTTSSSAPERKCLLSDNAETDTGLWDLRDAVVTQQWPVPARLHAQLLPSVAQHEPPPAVTTRRSAIRAFASARPIPACWSGIRTTATAITASPITSPTRRPSGRKASCSSWTPIPEPYLDPYWVARGVANELGIVFSRGSMRDAPFSRWPTWISPDTAIRFSSRRISPGVPPCHWFSDAQGLLSRHPRLVANLWRTWQWDASVVLPSSAFYGVRGLGYQAGTPLERILSTRAFIGTNEMITYQTNLFLAGLACQVARATRGTQTGITVGMCGLFTKRTRLPRW